MKEPRGKKVAVPNGISENGVLAAGLDVEVGKQAVQYQVCGPAPPPTRCRALPSGRGCRAGAFGLDLLGSLGAAHALPCLQNNSNMESSVSPLAEWLWATCAC